MKKIPCQPLNLCPVFRGELVSLSLLTTFVVNFNLRAVRQQELIVTVSHHATMTEGQKREKGGIDAQCVDVLRVDLNFVSNRRSRLFLRSRTFWGLAIAFVH